MSLDCPENQAARYRFASPPRRLLAFAVDLTLLAIPVWVLGGFLFETSGALGDYSRWIGWVAFMAYFTAYDSAWGGRQSHGKRALGIAVVRADGTPISHFAAAARAGFVSVPLFLHAAAPDTSGLPAMVLHSAVCAVFAVMLYLFIFNGRSRQSLHDLAFGTMVVRDGEPLPTHVPAWKGHWVVVGVILLAIASNTLLASDADDAPVAAELEQMQRDVAALPFVHSAQAVERTRECRTCKDRRRIRFIALRVELREALSDRDATLRQLTDAAFANREQFFDQRTLRLVVTRDFNLGIASVGRRNNARSDFASWRAGNPGTWTGASIRFSMPVGSRTSLAIF